MIDLDFAVTCAEAARHSAAPLLVFKLQISNGNPATPVEHVALQAQIRIEAAQRDYDANERGRLVELFGTAEDWDRGLRGLLWTTTSAAVPGFAEECNIELPVPCSYDFNIAATKFFHGVERGEVPLSLLFSGAIFFRNADGDLQIGQIPHHKEAGFRLPVSIWHAMMQHYYPDSLWLRIDRGMFEEIERYQRRNRLATVEEALRRLLAAPPAEARP